MKFIGIWILNPLKTSGGQPMAFGGFGIWLGGYFLCWILIIDPWVLSQGFMHSDTRKHDQQNSILVLL